MDSTQKEIEVQTTEKARTLGYKVKVAQELSIAEVELIGGGVKATYTSTGNEDHPEDQE